MTPTPTTPNESREAGRGTQFDYIARTYGKRFKRGQAVVALGQPGTVTGATHHVMVRLDGQKHANPYHPDDVTPKDSPK